jgi:hypothetical protein
LIKPTSGLTTASFDNGTVADLAEWRRYVAHDYTYYNSQTRETLTARVCGKKASLENRGNQLAAYEDLEAYIGEGDGTLVEVAPLMCIVALLMWILTIAQEFNAAYSLLSTIFAVPRGRKTVIFSADGDGR